jgi:TPR repeat protein
MEFTFKLAKALGETWREQPNISSCPLIKEMPLLKCFMQFFFRRAGASGKILRRQRNISEYQSVKEIPLVNWNMRLPLERRRCSAKLRGAAGYFRLSTIQGNADAQSQYGACLLNGQGVARCLDRAAHHFKVAAAQGNAVTQSNVAIAFGMVKELFEKWRKQWNIS